MNLRDLIRAAINEDLPTGDLTTDLLGLPPKQGRARLLAKQDLVLSGANPFEQVIELMEPGAQLTWHFEDGNSVYKSQIVCTIMGDLVQILKAERVALNFVMHLSGIATYTRKFVEQAAGTSTKILDTRKTTPGYRELEKQAVVHGGGFNHRLNLSDAILIKDNHIHIAGGITNAVNRIRQNSDLPIEIETRTLQEVQEAVKLPVQRLLLDNMNNEMLIEALKLIPSHIATEASGNMTMDRIKDVAKTGVNFISVGALTHSAPSADLSLKFDW